MASIAPPSSSARRPAAPVVAWAARRPTATAALLYAVLALLMVAPGLWPGQTLSGSDLLWTGAPWEPGRPASVPPLGSNQEQADAVTQFHPPLRVIRAALPDLPLWDPGTLSGRPLVADPQAGMFSPFSVPAFVLPFWKSLAVMAALKLFVAALGAFLLGRELRMRTGGALLCGLVFGFSLWAVSWTAWTVMSVWALLPWLGLFAERCVRRPGPGPAAGFGFAVGLCLLGGHPSSSFQVLAVVGLAWGVRALLARPRGSRLALRVAALGAGAVLGVALSAVMLVPFVELLGRSDDIEIRRTLSSLYHQEPRYLLGLFLPDYWGHGPTGQLFASYLPERAYYVGALPLMLAVAALVARPRVERVAVAAVGALMLVIAVGVEPLYGFVVGLPGFEAANNGRVAVVAVLCLALLAGWGLDDVVGGRLSAERRRLVLGAAVLLLVLPAAVALRRVDPDALGDAVGVALGVVTPTADLVAEADGGLPGLLRLAALLEWLVVAALALGLLLLALRRRLAGTALVACALVLVAGDLFKAGMGYSPAIPIAEADPPPTPAVRHLQASVPERFVGLRPTYPNAFVLPLAPNVAMRLGLQDARGYVQPTEERYAALWRAAIAPRDCFYFACLLLPEATPRALRALGLLGVGRLLQDRRDRPLRALPVTYRGPDATVYRNPSALPRAFLVDRQVVVAGQDAALAAVTSPRFAARRVAITETPIDGLPTASSAGAAGGGAGAARVARYERERVTVAVQARRPALLVLTDPEYPGWRATVDGEDADLHRVDFLLRGVAVPAGAHEVEFRYEPSSFRTGWVVSLLALVVLAALVAAARVRRRRRTGG